MRITSSFLAVAFVAFAGAPAEVPSRPIDAANVVVCDTSWPTPVDVVERAEAALLPMYGAEPTGYRADATLSIVVDGVRRPVAGGIGVDPDGTRISTLHTNACDGVLHVTAPEPIDIHLWQLFEQWGVRLTQHCLGERCDAEGVRIVLDGEEVEMCPGAISIQDGSRIELSIR